ESTNEIMVINWLKYNGSISPKVLERVIWELKNVKNKSFVNIYINLSNSLGYNIDRILVLDPNSIDKETEIEDIPYAYSMDSNKGEVGLQYSNNIDTNMQ